MDNLYPNTRWEEKEELEYDIELLIEYERRHKRFMHKVKGISQDTINFLTSNRAQPMKIIRSSLKNRVDLYIDKRTQSLDIRGPTEKDVKEGYICFIKLIKHQRPNLEIFKSSDSQYTHFLAINLSSHPEISFIQQQVISLLKKPKEESCVHSTELHMTLGMLDLNEEKNIVSILESFEEEVKRISEKRILELFVDRIGYFGFPKEPHVIILQILFNEDFRVLNLIHHFILKSLLDNGVLAQNEPRKQRFVLEENSVKYAYHISLYKRHGNELIDASNLLARKPRVLIPLQIDSIDLLSRDKQHPTDPYPVIHRLKWVN